MVFANIKDYEKYESLHENFKKVFKFLNREDLAALLPGRYEIDGDDVFALVQEYETKELEGAKYEAHQKYIDVQYMVVGTEKMGYFPVEGLSEFSPYDIDKDFMLLEGVNNLSLLRSRELFIFFPEDAHMPGIMLNKREKVRKVVIKVKV
ncbi:YhcH/YjgK/YiaL family protein [Clostridium swellfunianum]|uniref:YhcH/YjgK/YiaL family protein n=1 Tax=Clostridium swellfunianum TaxID=1367462 RepID=UPI00202E864A|nr:YhcH/YjgK/YiaL family protein [Clostridium swellfunianum]MCM0649347.1 YhcH/YjgK/YiaL family protein [Clostridium swellfunianum]